MALTFEIARDRADRPIVSASFVLARRPAPDERLGPIVSHAVVTFELEAVTDEGSIDRTRASVELASGAVRSFGTGPFGQVAVSLTESGAAAGALLQSLLLGADGPAVRVDARLAAQARGASRVVVALRRLWEFLDSGVAADRMVTAARFTRLLPALVEAGCVRIEGPRPPADAVAAAVLRVSRTVLAPDGTDRLRVADRAPGDQEVTASVESPPAHQEVATASRPIGELLGAAIADDPADFIEIVAPNGEYLDDIIPPRRASARRAGPAFTPIMLRTDAVMRPVALAAGAVAIAPAVSVVQPVHTLPIAAIATDLIFVRPDLLAEPEGPVVDTAGPALWPGRFDATRFWYVPEYAVVVPDPAGAADASPWRFDVRAAGHQLDGTAGLEAEIRVTLRSGMSAEVRAAWEAAGSPPAEPVPHEALTVNLGVPFRDEHGADRIQYHPAAEVVEGAGADAAELVATFRLSDDWARMAYGALSTPGFQAVEPTLTVGFAYSGWRRQAGWFSLAGEGKRATVLAERIGARRAGPGLAASHVAAVAKAGMRIDARIVDRPLIAQAHFFEDRFEWVRLDAISVASAVMPCADFGALYRRTDTQGGPTAIGCQSALQLGQAEFRTFERLDVPAARGWGAVLRSLTRPGYFVLVPSRYLIGRFAADSADRPFEPQIVLTSVLDDDDAKLRAVLAASVDADVPPVVRTAIVRQLRERSSEVVLDLPFAAGLAQEVKLALPGSGELQTIPTPTGFTVVATLEVSDFLVVRAMLETSGIIGGATLTLPGGETVASTLTLFLSQITGPYAAGPVEVARADGKVALTNRIGSPVAVTGVVDGVGARTPVAVTLAADETAKVDIAGTGPFEAEYTAKQTKETLDEVRVYVEELELEVVFVLAELRGAVALEVTTTLLGRAAPPVVLDAAHRQVVQLHQLPLTSYVSDPTLELAVTAVGADGSRVTEPTVTWSIRRQGAVIPVSAPEPGQPQ